MTDSDSSSDQTTLRSIGNSEPERTGAATDTDSDHSTDVGSTTHQNDASTDGAGAGAGTSDASTSSPFFEDTADVLESFENTLAVVPATTTVEGQVRNFTADNAINEWLEWLEDSHEPTDIGDESQPPHKYRHYQVRVKRDVSMAEQATRSYSQAGASPSDKYVRKSGFGLSKPIVTQALGWLLKELARPYLDPAEATLPIARQVPKDRLKVLVPEPALDYLTDDPDTLKDALERFDELPENEITPRERHLRRARHRVPRRPTSDGPILTHHSNLEDELRNRLGFGPRIGSGRATTDIAFDTRSVPPSHSEFADWTLNELYDELQETRRVLARLEPYREWLTRTITAIEPTYETLVANHFPEFADDLIDDSSDGDGDGGKQSQLPGSNGIPTFDPTDYPQSFWAGADHY